MITCLTIILASGLRTTLHQPSTSQGIIAQGLSDVNTQVITMSDELQNALAITNQNLIRSINLSANAADILLQNAINNRIYQLTQIQEEINEISMQISQNNNCDLALTCNACVSNLQCVWCEVEKSCYGGDQFGPYKGECTEFQHRRCTGCVNHPTCEICIADPNCGFCEFGGNCMTGSREDTNSCQSQYFYRQDIPGKTVCPLIVPNHQQFRQEAASTQLLDQLEVLLTQQQTIQRQIEVIETERREIIANASVAQQVRIDIYEGFQDLRDLVDQVDQLRQDELEQLQNHFQEQIEGMQDSIAGTYTASSESGREQIIGLMESYTQGVQDQIPIQTSALTSDITAMMNQISNRYIAATGNLINVVQEGIDRLNNI